LKPNATSNPAHGLETANAIVFIACDKASFITGHVLHVDGGKTAG
jgi:NAD(P)-dependent dehydrogenase (short-subunit alcohol dehydrogenase family)